MAGHVCYGFCFSTMWANSFWGPRAKFLVATYRCFLCYCSITPFTLCFLLPVLSMYLFMILSSCDLLCIITVLFPSLPIQKIPLLLAVISVSNKIPTLFIQAYSNIRFNLHLLFAANDIFCTFHVHTFVVVLLL